MCSEIEMSEILTIELTQRRQAVVHNNVQWQIICMEMCCKTLSFTMSKKIWNFQMAIEQISNIEINFLISSRFEIIVCIFFWKSPKMFRLRKTSSTDNNDNNGMSLINSSLWRVEKLK